MKHDEIDRILASDAPIEPSPGFAASVMRAVEREAVALLPLAFPWLRALPAFLAVFVAVVAATWHGIGILRDPAAVAVLNEQLTEAARLAAGYGLQWIAIALAITAVSLTLTAGVVRRTA